MISRRETYARQETATVHPFILPLPFLRRDMEAQSREVIGPMPLSTWGTEGQAVGPGRFPFVPVAVPDTSQSSRHIPKGVGETLHFGRRL